MLKIKLSKAGCYIFLRWRFLLLNVKGVPSEIPIQYSKYFIRSRQTAKMKTEICFAYFTRFACIMLGIVLTHLIFTQNGKLFRSPQTGGLWLRLLPGRGGWGRRGPDQTRESADSDWGIRTESAN